MFKILDMYMQPKGASKLNFNLYRVYKNSNAKDLYMKAQWKESAHEKQDIYNKMGEYELVDIRKLAKIKVSEIKDIFKDTLNDLKSWYSVK